MDSGNARLPLTNHHCRPRSPMACNGCRWRRGRRAPEQRTAMQGDRGAAATAGASKGKQARAQSPGAAGCRKSAPRGGGGFWHAAIACPPAEQDRRGQQHARSGSVHAGIAERDGCGTAGGACAAAAQKGNAPTHGGALPTTPDPCSPTPKHQFQTPPTQTGPHTHRGARLALAAAHGQNACSARRVHKADATQHPAQPA